MKCLDTVLFRHHMIQKDHVVFGKLEQVQCLISAFCFINLNLGSLNKVLNDNEIHRIIIDNKYTCIGRFKAFLILLPGL